MKKSRFGESERDPGVGYLPNNRIKHYNHNYTEISSEKAGQNCLGHNDPPTPGVLGSDSSSVNP